MNMMVLKSFIGVLAFICVGVASAATRTLVVLDNEEQVSSYSTFMDQLKSRGHDLSVYAAEGSSKELRNAELMQLEKYGESQYDNVVLFASEAASIPGFSVHSLSAFTDKGGNVLAASSRKNGKFVNKYAASIGVALGNKGTLVMDHFEDSDDVYDALVKSTKYMNNKVVLGNVANSKKPVAFDGVGATLKKDSILTFSVLRAPDSAYSASPAKDVWKTPLIAGDDISLVSGVQGHNNARMMISGSVDLFSNKFMNDKKLANAEFVNAVTAWTFGETGVLRASNVRHSRADGSLPDKMLNAVDDKDMPETLYPYPEVDRNSLVYRIKDNLTYSFDLEELRNGKWQPFKADDVQLEFVMLDPYVRKTMKHNNKGRFTVTFESPDAYGIFTFRVMYRRLGYSTIHLTDVVSLRPYKHDEYERFIVSAFPYYSGVFVMMAGVFVFSFVFLYSGDKAAKVKRS